MNQQQITDLLNEFSKINPQTEGTGRLVEIISELAPPNQDKFDAVRETMNDLMLKRQRGHALGLVAAITLLHGQKIDWIQYYFAMTDYVARN